MRIIVTLIVAQSIGWLAFFRHQFPPKEPIYKIIASDPEPISLLSTTNTNVANGLVRIVVSAEDSLSSTSTGFVLTTNATQSFVITNAHLCEEISDMSNPVTKIISQQDDSNHQADIVYWDSDRDLCLLSTPWIGTPLPLASKGEKIKKGREVLVATAKPIGDDQATIRFSKLSPWQVKAKGRDFHRPLMGLSMDTEPGQSGSPVFNEEKRVIGVLFGAAGSWLGVAVHVDELYDFIYYYNQRISRSG